MIKLIRTTIVALVLGTVPINSNAETGSGGAVGLGSWTGTWSTADGAVISIVSNDGFLDVLGKDMASIFELTCIVADVPDRDRAECIGHGVNHSSTLRFLYKSTMSINAEGSISEKWQADSWDAKTKKRNHISGSAKFRKSKLEESEAR